MVMRLPLSSEIVQGLGGSIDADLMKGVAGAVALLTVDVHAGMLSINIKDENNLEATVEVHLGNGKILPLESDGTRTPVTADNFDPETLTIDSSGIWRMARFHGNDLAVAWRDMVVGTDTIPGQTGVYRGTSYSLNGLSRIGVDNGDFAVWIGDHHLVQFYTNIDRWVANVYNPPNFLGLFNTRALAWAAVPTMNATDQVAYFDGKLQRVTSYTPATTIVYGWVNALPQLLGITRQPDAAGNLPTPTLDDVGELGVEHGTVVIGQQYVIEDQPALVGGVDNNAFAIYSIIADGSFRLAGENFVGVDLDGVGSHAQVVAIVQAAIRASTNAMLQTVDVIYEGDPHYHWILKFPDYTGTDDIFMEAHSDGTGTDLSALMHLREADGAVFNPPLVVNWRTYAQPGRVHFVGVFDDFEELLAERGGSPDVDDYGYVEYGHEQGWWIFTAEGWAHWGGPPHWVGRFDTETAANHAVAHLTSTDVGANPRVAYFNGIINEMILPYGPAGGSFVGYRWAAPSDVVSLQSRVGTIEDNPSVVDVTGRGADTASADKLSQLAADHAVPNLWLPHLRYTAATPATGTGADYTNADYLGVHTANPAVTEVNKVYYNIINEAWYLSLDLDGTVRWYQRGFYDIPLNTAGLATDRVWLHNQASASAAAQAISPTEYDADSTYYFYNETSTAQAVQTLATYVAPAGSQPYQDYKRMARADEGARANPEARSAQDQLNTIEIAGKVWQTPDISMMQAGDGLFRYDAIITPLSMFPNRFEVIPINATVYHYGHDDVPLDDVQRLSIQVRVGDRYTQQIFVDRSDILSIGALDTFGWNSYTGDVQVPAYLFAGTNSNVVARVPAPMLKPRLPWIAGFRSSAQPILIAVPLASGVGDARMLNGFAFTLYNSGDNSGTIERISYLYTAI